MGWHSVYFLPLITLSNTWNNNVWRITAHVSRRLISAANIQPHSNRMWQTWKTPQDCASTPGCPSIKQRHWHLPTMPQGARCEYLTIRDVSYRLLGDFNGSGAALREVISDHLPRYVNKRVGGWCGNSPPCAYIYPHLYLSALGWLYFFL